LLTPECAAQIVLYGRDGLSFVDACILSGVSERRAYEWQALCLDGANSKEEPSGVLLAVFAEHKKARLALKHELITNVKSAIESDPKLWASNMTLLERMFPDEFARTERVSLTAIGANIGQDYDRLKTLLQDPAFRATADSLLARLGSTRE